VSDIDETGLTAEERAVVERLVDAWNAFMKMESAITTEEQQRFRDAIHLAQQVFADRALHRAYPGYWT
jgi:hypothetical protein